MNSLITANVKQRPLRTAISIVGVALGVVLTVLVVGLARGTTRDSADRQSRVDAEIRFYAGGNVGLTGANPLMMPAGYADAILNGVRATAENPDVAAKPPVPGVAAVSPVGTYVQSSVAGLGFELVDGIDYESFTQTTELRIVQGRAIGDGHRPGSEYEAIIDGYYLENATDTAGRPVKIGSEISVLGHTFAVVGVFEPSVMARVKIPLHTMQQLLGGADNCTFVMIRTTNPDAAEQVKSALNEMYPGNSVILNSELPALYSQGIRAVEVFLNVVIGLAVVISCLVILLAMYTTIIERTREIGILKSLGASKGFIVGAIEKEAALISALGVAFGFVVSIVGKYVIENSTRLKIDLRPEWLLIAALIGIGGGLLGALYPAVRAANLDPVEAISYD